jgi:hypothetical protein
VSTECKPWTDAEIAILHAHYPNETAEAVAARLGCTVRRVYNKVHLLELKKSPEFFASAAAHRLDGIKGGKTRFKRGQPAWNKGMKGLQIGGEATRFTKGQMPHNTQPVGSYRLDKDGTLQRKISNDKGNNSVRWRGVHELVWIETNGPMPPKHIVIFKPGMRTNVLEEITVDKVECISLAENMRRNTRHRLPKELNEVIQLRAVLTRHINKRSKQDEQENH